jgi:hypothetical protein
MFVVLRLMLRKTPGREDQWESHVRNKKITTLYILDRFSRITPLPNEVWLCETTHTIFTNPNSNFRIERVALVEKIIDSEQIFTFTIDRHRKKSDPNEREWWRLDLEFPKTKKIKAVVCTPRKGNPRPKPGEETWHCMFSYSVVVKVEEGMAILAFKLLKPANELEVPEEILFL